MISEITNPSEIKTRERDSRCLQLKKPQAYESKNIAIAKGNSKCNIVCGKGKPLVTAWESRWS